MKPTPILALILFLAACSNTTSQNSEGTGAPAVQEITGADYLDEEEMYGPGGEVDFRGKVIAEQSFPVSFEGLEARRFVSTRSGDNTQIFFFLVGDEGTPLYEFPLHGGNEWFAETVEAVAFTDLNGDGKKDVIAIVGAVTGMGRGGMVPFPVGNVYVREGNIFHFPTELNNEIVERQDTTIAQVAAFAKQNLQ